MEARRRITEYLEVDLSTERWSCTRCGGDLGDARDTYKKGCLIADRDPREVHPPIIEGVAYNFAPDPEWCRIVEFYCPGCGPVETSTSPGHPLTHTSSSTSTLKARAASEAPAP